MQKVSDKGDDVISRTGEQVSDLHIASLPLICLRGYTQRPFELPGINGRHIVIFTYLCFNKTMYTGKILFRRILVTHNIRKITVIGLCVKFKNVIYMYDCVRL